MSKLKNVVIIGFGKSATTTLDKALASCGYNTFHQNVSLEKTTVPELLACSYKNSGDPFEQFREYAPFAITQMDYTNPSKGLVAWPQLDYEMLEAGYNSSDDTVYILNYREPHSLTSSFFRWKNGEFIQRVTDADLPGLRAGVGWNENDVFQWIHAHYDECRRRFAGSERFLEVNIHSSNFREIVEDFLSVQFSWWGKENVNVL